MKALFEIDDPDLEQALTVILERIAAAGSRASSNAPPPPNPKTGRRRKLPQAFRSGPKP
jgi:hypothetical protein